MKALKQKIFDTVYEEERQAIKASEGLKDTVLLTDYAGLVTVIDGERIWTKALQKALKEHESVIIPADDGIYFIDSTVVIPSGRKITAYGAKIRLTKDCKLLMLRNEHTKNGTEMPQDRSDHDENIFIFGGSWQESNTKRLGYGATGKYDEERSFYGVSTLFLFNNIKNLVIKDAEFYHTAGFSVQTGDAENVFFENIRFRECFADGLHINGNCRNVLCKNIKGKVGDDLVALNMYDWQNSSVNFGPSENVICEELELEASPDGYKALRIEPGTYCYRDGSSVDCSLKNAVIRDVKGIMTFKMYYQTPVYKIGQKPENGAVGSADNIFFENIDVDLKAPIDAFDEYLYSDETRGYFGAFEFGCNMGYISFENISLTLYREKYPLSRLAVVGPKSCVVKDSEVFDPYLSSRVKTVEFGNITVNGKRADDIGNLIHETVFDNVNNDGASTASGKIESIILDGKRIR